MTLDTQGEVSIQSVVDCQSYNPDPGNPGKSLYPEEIQYRHDDVHPQNTCLDDTEYKEEVSIQSVVGYHSSNPDPDNPGNKVYIQKRSSTSMMMFIHRIHVLMTLDTQGEVSIQSVVDCQSYNPDPGNPGKSLYPEEIQYRHDDVHPQNTCLDDTEYKGKSFNPICSCLSKL